MSEKEHSLEFSLQGGYADAPESTDHCSIADNYGQFIDGSFTAPAEKGSIVVLNPATEEQISSITPADADAVDAAGVKAVELGYRYVMECATQSEGDVSVIAEHARQPIN